jgi:ribosomal-protein-alanine N-acetyltransferase
VTPVVRKARPGDLRAMLEIERETFPEPWAAEDFETDDCLVAEMDNHVVGFLVSRQIFPANAGERAEREILNVAVRRGYRRKGIATALLNHELSRRAIFFLEVRKSNLAARELYSKLGFVEVGRRPEYYDFPVETAIVMQMK